MKGCYARQGHHSRWYKVRTNNIYSSILQKAKDAAVEEYKKATKKTTEVTVDEQSFLASDWYGFPWFLEIYVTGL